MGLGWNHLGVIILNVKHQESASAARCVWRWTRWFCARCRPQAVARWASLPVTSCARGVKLTRHVTCWQTAPDTSSCLRITSHSASEPGVTAGNERGPQTQHSTHRNSITERCMNQFCVKQQAGYVTAHRAVANEYCHKQNPPEETWHPSQPRCCEM